MRSIVTQEREDLQRRIGNLQEQSEQLQATCDDQQATARALKNERLLLSQVCIPLRAQDANSHWVQEEIEF